MSEEKACGFIALIGAPNAGKSTLLNALVGQKISIVTPKVQTTRNAIRGVCIEGNSQLVFVDTPGIFSAKQTLERAIVDAAWQGADEADVIALVVDAKKGIDKNTRQILETLIAKKIPASLIINKIDLIPLEKLLPLTKELNDMHPFEQVFMVSALKNDGVKDIKKYFASKVAKGPWLYPADQVAEAPLRFLAAEIVREQLFLQLEQELPYRLTVITEHMEELDKGGYKIHVVIYVAKDGQKRIILGKGGHQIKSVGEKARKELMRVTGLGVQLYTFIKVKENWLDRPELYQDMGLNFPK